VEALAAKVTSLRQEMDALVVKEVRAETSEEAASFARVRRGYEGKIGRLLQEIDRLRRQEEAGNALDHLAKVLPLLSEDFAEEWEEMLEWERRAVVNTLIECIEVVTEPVPGRRKWRREVTAVTYQEWVARSMSE
jgi:intergrase/recombinase